MVWVESPATCVARALLGSVFKDVYGSSAAFGSSKIQLLWSLMIVKQQCRHVPRIVVRLVQEQFLEQEEKDRSCHEVMS